MNEKCDYEYKVGDVLEVPYPGTIPMGVMITRENSEFRQVSIVRIEANVIFSESSTQCGDILEYKADIVFADGTEAVEYL